MKSICLKTLGCKVNQYETQAMREKFLRAGFREAEENSGADLFLVNTCTVTGEAERKSRSLVRRLHRENPKAEILVTGCFATDRFPEARELPGVSLVVPNCEKDLIVEKISGGHCSASVPEEKSLLRSDYGCMEISRFSGRTRAFVKIQDGCNRACTYCKVTQVRGQSRSRPLGKVVSEAKRLAAQGYREIVLACIQLGAYGADLGGGADLARVLGELIPVPGLERIRLSSIDPSDISDQLIRLLAENPKLCPHLHVPLQSGDDRILGKMKRAYRAEQYKALVRRLRESVPDFSLTTDVMAGFPGENEEQFENTVSVLREIKPLKTHIFPFSPREGTAAYSFTDRVERPVMEARVKRLQAICAGIAEEFRSSFLGRTMEVLTEGDGPAAGMREGHTSNYLVVRFAVSPEFVGGRVPVELLELRKGFVLGKMTTCNQKACAASA